MSRATTIHEALSFGLRLTGCLLHCPHDRLAATASRLSRDVTRPTRRSRRNKQTHEPLFNSPNAALTGERRLP
jgi:hypothetical protein